MTKQVLQQALEALELAVRQNSHDMLMTGEEIRKGESAIEALREALAQQEKPVAWVDMADGVPTEQPRLWQEHSHDEVPLYAKAAPAAQPVQGDEYVRGFQDGMKEAPTGECWIRVIDEAMVGAHLGVADMADDYGTAKKKLNDLICWSVEIDRESARHAPAAQPDWSLLEATQESLREHMAMVKELRAKLAQQDTWSDDGGWVFPIEGYSNV